MESVSTLRQLGDVIQKSIEEIECHMSTAGANIPSSTNAWDPESPSEKAFAALEILHARQFIAAASAQLISIVRNPVEAVIDDSLKHLIPSCLRAAAEANLFEIIREAGPEGIHVAEIAQISKKDPLKTARILRALANRSIFREVEPDVFAATRLSSVVDTGKSVAELHERPKDKYIGTNGVNALIAMAADEVGKGAMVLPEAYLDPKLAHSVSPTETPFNLAFKTDKVCWDWLAEPENAEVSKRFGVAMKGSTLMEPAGAVLQGFCWRGLPEGSKVVDIGGGIGATSMIVAKAHPHLKFVVQDLPIVVADAEAFWKHEYPEAVSQNRVSFEVHDFFTPQTTKDADVYLARFIFHNWANPSAKKILEALKMSAKPGAKLLVIDAIIPHACRAKITDEIPGAALPDIPEPLLPSLGPVNDIRFWWDLTMYVWLNAQERTLGHFAQLVTDAGWEIERVHRIPGSPFSQYVLVPK